MIDAGAINPPAVGDPFGPAGPGQAAFALLGLPGTRAFSIAFHSLLYFGGTVAIVGYAALLVQSVRRHIAERHLAKAPKTA